MNYNGCEEMIIDIVTIFPEMLHSPFTESIINRAVSQRLVEIDIVDLRNYASGKHRQVDDAPYGGGCGMIFKPEPLFLAVEDLKKRRGRDDSRVILLTPRGRLFKQDYARQLVQRDHLIILCGRYEGVDERVREGLVDDEISIGDYILTGGELAAAVITDAVVRLLPGLLEEESVNEESFSEHLLEYPQYTRPHVYRGMEVPPVLLSGNHEKIARWRRCQSLKITRERRPDLLSRAKLSNEDMKYLEGLDKKHEE